MPYHDQPLCLCTAATSRMLSCSTEIQEDFWLSWYPKNGNLNFLSLGWTNCDQCVGAVMASVCQERVRAMNLTAFRTDFTKACANWEPSLHIGRQWCSDTIEGATDTSSLFSYHTVCSNSSRWSLTFMKGQVNNTQTARPHAVHTSFHVINLNKILASNKPKLFKKFHFS